VPLGGAKPRALLTALVLDAGHVLPVDRLIEAVWGAAPLVARYADACNLFATGVDDVARKLEVLRTHCAAENRDYDAVEKTVAAMGPILDDPDAFLANANQYAKLGVSEIQVMPDRHPVAFAEQLAERITPRLADIG
jgi:alkanesulfonate monooxygenase SsuD/methylene tetrahydromethanopterin reductase-like flavin-dependent oxidoreductase (luciferase family)